MKWISKTQFLIATVSQYHDRETSHPHPSRPVPWAVRCVFSPTKFSIDLFLSPAFVQTCGGTLDGTLFRPIMQGCRGGAAKLVDQHGDVIVDASRTSKGT